MLISSSQCVILAAGKGNRLHPFTNLIPKTLLPINNKPILYWLLNAVYSSGINDCAIVVGYKKERIYEFLSDLFKKNIVVIENELYDSTNNAYSLWLAKEFCLDNGKQDSPLLLLDSDIIFERGLLTTFLTTSVPDSIVIRSQGEHDSEEMKVELSEEKYVVRFGKDLPISETTAESVGIEWFSSHTKKRLFEILDERMISEAGKNEFYENSFQQLIDEGYKLSAYNVGSSNVLEIDTMKDYYRAMQIRTE